MPEYEQQLIKYLKDVHSIEEQALTQLKAARNTPDSASWSVCSKTTCTRPWTTRS